MNVILQNGLSPAFLLFLIGLLSSYRLTLLALLVWIPAFAGMTSNNRFLRDLCALRVNRFLLPFGLPAYGGEVGWGSRQSFIVRSESPRSGTQRK